MSNQPATLPPWPALTTERNLPKELSFDRMVWGKVPESNTDFRWICSSLKNVAEIEKNLERRVYVGNEDRPIRFLLWRAINNTHYAIQSYPSRARDHAGRSGFLEKQFVRWQHKHSVPAALGALLFLVYASRLNDSVWWEQKDNYDLLNIPNYVLDMDLDEPFTLQVDLSEINILIERGVQQLVAVLDEERLGHFYGQLLAKPDGIRPLLLTTPAPLPPEAMAVLLLPIARPMSDSLSLCGWLPSSTVQTKLLMQEWNVVLCNWQDQAKDAVEPSISSEHLKTGRKMAQALLSNHPEIMLSTTCTSQIHQIPPPEVTENSVQLTMWGPSASGKTIYLSQLYLQSASVLSNSDWEILPTETLLNFVQPIRERMHINNRLPAATTSGEVFEIEYLFKNKRTGKKAVLHMEDRAGKDYETLEESSKIKLRNANGLILLLDLFNGEGVARRVQVLQKTLEFLFLTSKTSEPETRPVAVCITKADVLIRNPEDYDRCLKNPDQFVRKQLSDKELAVIETFCKRYQLFPVSSTGVGIKYGVVYPSLFFDENLTTRISTKNQPINMVEPFLWLMETISGSKA